MQITLFGDYAVMLFTVTVTLSDETTLAMALNTLIEAPEYAQALGQAGRARAIEHFNVEQMAKDTMTLYESLCADKFDKNFL